MMKKQLSTIVLITTLMSATSAQAGGMLVFDAINTAVDKALHSIDVAWQKIVKSDLGQMVTKAGETVDKVQGVTDKIQDVFNKTASFMNDPVNSAVTTVGLNAKKTEQMQYLPEDYTDEQVNTFSAGKSNSDIGRYAQETYDLINEGKDDLFTINGHSKGQFEKAVPDRDAKEAAYYLAMSEEAYYMASQRYEQINKDYESKIKNATELKDKQNLQMNLQGEQLLLQSQLIQLTALKQTHEARKEVADQRKQVLQKMKKDNRRISLR